MKKLINSPDNVVSEMLEGITKTHSHIQLIENTNIIVRSDILQIREKQVTLISGGGSGHVNIAFIISF
jgi:dihydroxyacetone kinase